MSFTRKYTPDQVRAIRAEWDAIRAYSTEPESVTEHGTRTRRKGTGRKVHGGAVNALLKKWGGTHGSIIKIVRRETYVEVV